MENNWYSSLLEFSKNLKCNSMMFNGKKLEKKKQIIFYESKRSKKQDQTKRVFGYKWNKIDSYKEGLTKRHHKWLKEKYKKEFYVDKLRKNSIILDAGCGSAISSELLFGKYLKNLRFIGVDISNAIEVACSRFNKNNINSIFIQCDLNKIPLFDESIDLIFSEGVLHHTDNPFKALMNITKKLKKKGLILFYIYKKKAPVREYTDKLLRDKLKKLKPEEAWKKLEPLTRLGIQLGEIKPKITIKENIDLLGIPSGKISIQRLFYWYFFKCFYSDDITFDEMNHVNFDWFSPQNASTHTEQEIKSWCKKLNLNILKFNTENAGFSIIAKKV